MRSRGSEAAGARHRPDSTEPARSANRRHHRNAPWSSTTAVTLKILPPSLPASAATSGLFAWAAAGRRRRCRRHRAPCPPLAAAVGRFALVLAVVIIGVLYIARDFIVPHRRAFPGRHTCDRRWPRHRVWRRTLSEDITERTEPSLIVAWLREHPEGIPPTDSLRCSPCFCRRLSQ